MSLSEARSLDDADPLARFRARFALPEGIVYLDGNSLGALPKETADRIAHVVRQEWGAGLIGSWNASDWIGAPQRVGTKIASIIGAHADEVIVTDSTSINLYKLLAAALMADHRRRVILTEEGNFPTDLYIAQGLASAHADVSVRTLPRDQIAVAAGPDTVVLLTHVHYKTGERFDMASVTKQVQSKGGLILWDLSHSAGAVELELDVDNVDLAVGCGYKYLNGGPGAPAFLYVARRHQALLQSPLSGWMGHATPFTFDDDYCPAPDMRRFLCGTPSILAIAALECGVDLFVEADMAMIASKSVSLCDRFIMWMESECAGLGVTLVTPRGGSTRGSHVSFAHPMGYPIMQALISNGVIGDFREPDVMRFGFAPLYTSYCDTWSAVRLLKQVLTEGSWDMPRFRERNQVT